MTKAFEVDEDQARNEASFLRKGLFQLKRIRKRCEHSGRTPRSPVVRDLMTLLATGSNEDAGDEDDDNDDECPAEGKVVACPDLPTVDLFFELLFHFCSDALALM